MPYNSDIHHRHSIRLREYDYSQAGAYFVTICTQNRECLLGEIVEGEMRLNAAGNVAADSWAWLADQYDYVELDHWVVMPNHIHGIIVITDDRRGEIYHIRRGGSRDDRRGEIYHIRRGGSRTAPTTEQSDIGSRTAPTTKPTIPTTAQSDIGGQPAPTTEQSDIGGQPAPTKEQSDIGSQPAPTKPLGRLIGAFKTVSTRRINEQHAMPGAKFWQRNYYEHIIRNEADLDRIREYIENNSLRWELDKLNPVNM